MADTIETMTSPGGHVSVAGKLSQGLARHDAQTIVRRGRGADATHTSFVGAPRVMRSEEPTAPTLTHGPIDGAAMPVLEDEPAICKLGARWRTYASTLLLKLHA